MNKSYVMIKYYGGDNERYRFSVSKRHRQSDKFMTLTQVKTKLVGITSVMPYGVATYIDSDIVELNNGYLLLFNTVKEAINFLNFLKGGHK